MWPMVVDTFYLRRNQVANLNVARLDTSCLARSSFRLLFLFIDNV